jgi:hypothetical protein
MMALSAEAEQGKLTVLHLVCNPTKSAVIRDHSTAAAEALLQRKRTTRVMFYWVVGALITLVTFSVFWIVAKAPSDVMFPGLGVVGTISLFVATHLVYIGAILNHQISSLSLARKKGASAAGYHFAAMALFRTLRPVSHNDYNRYVDDAMNGGSAYEQLRDVVKALDFKRMSFRLFEASVINTFVLALLAIAAFVFTYRQMASVGNVLLKGAVWIILAAITVSIVCALKIEFTQATAVGMLQNGQLLELFSKNLNEFADTMNNKSAQFRDPNDMRPGILAVIWVIAISIALVLLIMAGTWNLSLSPKRRMALGIGLIVVALTVLYGCWSVLTAEHSWTTVLQS